MAGPENNPYLAAGFKQEGGDEQNPYLAAGFKAEAQEQPQLSLGDRWKAAQNNPDERRRLATEIGAEFAERQYGPENPRGWASAFGKTGQDMIGFGLGRRKLRKEARKAFPGMTKEEASIVADEAERLQFEMRPVSTIAGGTVGLIGGIGATGGATGVAARAPGVGAVVRPLMIQAPQRTAAQVAASQPIGSAARLGNAAANAARGAGGGAAGFTAYEAIANERSALENPEGLALSAGVGAVAPAVAQKAGDWIGRAFFPRQAARRVLNERVGPAGAQAADDFTAATGRPPPVAAAALDENAAAQISPMLLGPRRASSMIARGERETAEQLMADIQSRLPASQRATAGAIDQEVDFLATDFGNQFGGVEIDIGPEGRNMIAQVLRSLRDDYRLPEGTLSDSQINALRTGVMPLETWDSIRRTINSATQNIGDRFNTPVPGERARAVLNYMSEQIDQQVPGYLQNIITGFRSGRVRAEGARTGARVLGDLTPEEFSRQAGIVPGRPAPEPEITQGVREGAAEALRVEAGTPTGARALVSQIATGDPAANVRTALGQQGDELVSAAQQWDRAARGPEMLSPASTADAIRPTPRQGAMAIGAQSAYFAVTAVDDILRNLQLPSNVRREITDMLTNPARVNEAIEAMRRVGVPQEAMDTALRITMAAQTGAGIAGAGQERDRIRDLTQYPEFAGRERDLALEAVSMALFDIRGGTRPNTPQELDAAEDMIDELMAQGVPADEAVDIVVSRLASQ